MNTKAHELGLAAEQPWQGSHPDLKPVPAREKLYRDTLGLFGVPVDSVKQLMQLGSCVKPPPRDAGQIRDS